MDESDNSDIEENIYKSPAKGQEKQMNINEIKDNLNSSNKKDILSKYCSMICYLLIKKISIKLYLSNDKIA